MPVVALISVAAAADVADSVNWIPPAFDVCGLYVAAAADVADSLYWKPPAFAVCGLSPAMARATRHKGLLVDQRVSFTAARLRYHERTL